MLEFHIFYLFVGLGGIILQHVIDIPVGTNCASFLSDILICSYEDEWRAVMILKGHPKTEWPELRLKTVAQDLLKGQRSEWGYKRKWEGNYLSISKDNSNTMEFVVKMNHLKTQDKFTSIIFSCMVKKINKHSTPADRSIAVTDKFIYKLDQKKKFKPMRKGIPLSEVTGVSVTPGKDQLIAIHLSSENDIVVCLQNPGKEERIGEFVGTLGRQWQLMNKELKVQTLKPVHCMLGGKRRTVAVRPTANNGGPTFQKDGVDIALLWTESS